MTVSNSRKVILFGNTKVDGCRTSYMSMDCCKIGMFTEKFVPSMDILANIESCETRNPVDDSSQSFDFIFIITMVRSMNDKIELNQMTINRTIQAHHKSLGTTLIQTTKYMQNSFWFLHKRSLSKPLHCSVAK